MCVPFHLVENIAALVELLAWHRRDNNPLSEPMMVKVADAYMRHLASMS